MKPAEIWLTLLAVVVIFIAVGALSSGCTPTPPGPLGQGKLRLEIFYKCLELAKQTQTETHYNDADELVYECSLQSKYISNHIYSTGG